MNLSVLAPVRDEGPSLREHVHACLSAISDLGVEIVLLDDRSVDGCCHGLPREVLIVRTERFSSPARLWRLGGSLARGEGLLWVPRLLSHPPDRFRALVVAALGLVDEEATADRGPAPRWLSFRAARGGPALLTPRARSRADRRIPVPVLGHFFPALAARWLPLVVPSATDGHETRMPVHTKACVSPPATDGDSGGPTPSRPDAARAGSVRRGAKRLSVIITAHNEGAEMLRTVESVRAGTRVDHEVIVVDDGSTDDSCSALEAPGVRVIRHADRVGVAYSRDAGSRAAVGDVFAYLDGHQRVAPDCLDRCAEVALAHGAIVCPPLRPLNRRYPVGYGACFTLCPERGFFSSRSRLDRPRHEVTRISGLRSPGYVIPRSAYNRVAWITGLRGWGATDYCAALKAFFADVDILFVNAGGTSHLFRKRIPYETTWDGV